MTGDNETREGSRTLHESVIETMADGVFVLDPDGTIIFLNQAIESFIGIERDDLVGESVKRVADSAVFDDEAIGHVVTAIGLLALPFFVLVEALGPLIEGVGYLIVPIALVLGLLNVPFFVLFVAVAVGLGTLMSWLSAFNEVYGFRRYTHPRDIARILLHGIVENVLYRQWKAVIAWRGLVQFLRGDTSWGEMTRVGLE